MLLPCHASTPLPSPCCCWPSAPSCSVCPDSDTCGFNGLLIVWLVAARLGHVALHPAAYAEAPLDILKFWQPGFQRGGTAAALAWTLWSLRATSRALLGATD
nr:hypothetical protein [Halomonas elongata]